MKTTNNPLGILVMSSQLKKKFLAAAIATVGAMPVFAYAQAHADHGGGEMDHGDMQIQGGSAPPDARDPDAYSDGYVRNAGKYALPPPMAPIMSAMLNHSAGSSAGIGASRPAREASVQNGKA